MRGPPARVVDWTLFGVVLAAGATGVGALLTGEPRSWWVVWLHAVSGIAVAVLLWFKLRRVAPRLRPAAWDRSTVAGALAAVLAVAAIGTGIGWSVGLDFGVARWTGLFAHMVLGAVLVVPVLVHLAARFRPPSRHAFDRRVALQYAAVGATSVLALQVQETLAAVLETAGATRRFTGSRERESFAGNAFPTTSWVADDPDPIDADEWTLTVDGAVETSLEVGYEELQVATEQDAVLDCTSGWYSEQTWAGVELGDLLDAAGLEAGARWVSVRSTTGYRWSLPLEEARGTLLATAVSGETLSHGHGFPARLVAPGRRGFQWVKWVERVEVRRAPDYSQWVAIFVSGFD